MVFGLVQKKFQFRGWKETVLGLVLTVAALALGMLAPITAGKDTWTYITFVYIFFAAVLPMWLLKQPLFLTFIQMNYFLYLTIICVSAMILSTLHVIFAGSASPYLTGLLITLGTAIFAITFDTFILPISSFFPPLIIMLCVTGTALVERTIGLVKASQAGSAVYLVEGLQLIIAVLLMALGLVIVINSLKAYFGAKKESEA